MRVLTVCGSLQPDSSNSRFLDAIAAIGAAATDGVVVERSISVGMLPHFDPSLADHGVAVAALRSQLAAADAVVIAAPEYAHSLPGSLKNALDWIVGSGELHGKPVAVACATHATFRGHLGRAALEQTLRAHGASIVDSRSVVDTSMATDAVEVLTLLGAACTPTNPIS